MMGFLGGKAKPAALSAAELGREVNEMRMYCFAFIRERLEQLSAAGVSAGAQAGGAMARPVGSDALSDLFGES